MARKKRKSTIDQPAKPIEEVAEIEDEPVATTETNADDEALEVAEELEEITEAEGLEIRQQVLELKGKIDSAQFDMAGLLYKIYDRELFKQWGYGSFAKYTEDELGFGSRKALYMIGTHDYFVNDLASQEVIDKVRHLGWSKLKELRGVVDEDNVDEWVEKAENMNVVTLAEAARMALSTDFEDEEQEQEIEIAKTMSFKVFSQQAQNINNALMRASELTNSKKQGHLLDTICTDYLAQNAFTSDGKEAIAAFFAKFEDQLGIRIFALDVDKNECIYGEDEAIKAVIIDVEDEAIICGEETLKIMFADEEDEEDEEDEAATA